MSVLFFNKASTLTFTPPNKISSGMIKLGYSLMVFGTFSKTSVIPSYFKENPSLGVYLFTTATGCTKSPVCVNKP